MWLTEITKLLDEHKDSSTNHQKILLKEFFIKKALLYIYKLSDRGFLTFNGGTCLRILYDLPRLSEDIDLDILGDQVFVMEVFCQQVKTYFDKQLWLSIDTSIKSSWQTLLLKLPILKMYHLANDSQSDLLYIKFDIQRADNPFAQTQVSPYMKDNLFVMIKHYDLPSLFANKLKAIFGRDDKLFHDAYNFKGRDFFDMIWYLQQHIKPNFAVVQHFFATHLQQSLDNPSQLVDAIDHKIQTIDTAGIYDDMVNLVEDPTSIQQFSDHFVDIFANLKDRLTIK